MSDRIRQLLAYVIAVGMVAAVAAAPAVAQEADKNAERVLETAGLNADKVDGKHAVSYTTSKAKRAKKIVATNANGFLPSNIVKPQWNVIQKKPAGFADGVDDKGVTGIKLTRVAIDDVAVSAGGTKLLEPMCPSGSKVTGGGFWSSSAALQIVRNQPRSDLAGWAVYGLNTGASSLNMSAFAVCMSAQGGSITTATKG